MVTRENFPPDIRIEKEADALSDAGHEVLVFTPVATQSSEAEVPFRVFEYGFQTIPGANFDGLRRLFKQHRVEMVHLQDTPGSMQPFLAAKSLGLKVIYDIHEIWPALAIDNSQVLTYGTALWSATLRAEEAVAFVGANVSLTVVDEATDYFVRKYKLSDRVFPIRNFESLQRFRNIRPSQDFIDEQAFKITYVGGLDGPIRGIDEVLLAAARLLNENIQFLIVGSGYYMPWLQLIAKKMGLEKNVRFLGSKRFTDAMEVVAASDICLVPHKNCFSTQHTLPHKISQYMALQKPVVATNLTPIMRLFQSAFIQWEPRTSLRLAELIVSIRDNRSLALEVSRKAYGLVRDRYRWEDEGKRLTGVYETLSPR